MPKIPTYSQLGQRVKDVSPQIGLRADPGIVNSQLAAADFYAKAQDVAYNFSMAEQAENTKAAKSEIKALYNDQSNEVIRNSKKRDTVGAQLELEDFNKKFEKEYFNKGLNKRQVKEIKAEMILYQSSKMQNHKTLSFDRGRDYNSNLHNNAATALISEITKLPVGNQLRGSMEDELRDIYSTAIANGETANFEYSTHEDALLTIEVNDFTVSSGNADTLEKIDILKSELKNKSFLPETKLKLEALIDQDKTRVENEYVDAMQRYVFLNPEFMLEEKTYEKLLKRLKSSTSEIETKNIDGKVLKINPSKLPVALLERVASKVESVRSNQLSKQLDETSKSLSILMKDKSLSYLKNMQKEVDEKYKDYPFSHQTQIKSLIENEIKTKAKQAIDNAQSIVESMVSDIKADGLLSQENENKLDGVVTTLNLAEEYKLARTVSEQIKAEIKASSAFKIVQFQDAESVTKKTEELHLAWVKSNGNKKDELAYNSFKQQITNRNALQKNDFIGYYASQNKGKEITIENMISLQKSMNINELDIRVTTNDQLNKFEAEFNSGENTYSERAAIGNNFITSFGVNQNRVLRHLIRTKTITPIDNLLMAYPEDARIKGVIFANNAETIKSVSASVTSADKTTIREAVVLEMGGYTETVLGGGYDKVLGGGYTQGRADHVTAMRDMVVNTAQYYKSIGLDSTASAKRAYSEVIGNHYNLDNKVNDVTVRFSSEYNEIAQPITTILQTVLRENTDYLKTIIEAPPPPPNLSEEAKIAWSNEYFSDLSKKGTWRTTTDNEGVYLVDALGNIAKRISPTMFPDEFSSNDNMNPFVTIKLTNLFTSIDKLAEIQSKDVYEKVNIAGRRSQMVIPKETRLMNFLKTRQLF
tara:strand:+ start:5418 stop:8039 length:2622 start_codon:yes stop_codon:yes gene_type:complete